MGTPARQPRVLVAPDKFRGSLTAPEVARHLARGLRSGPRPAEVIELPIADGGEGTVDAAVQAGFAPITCRVSGPLGGSVEARYALRGATAVIELAQASGLQLVPSHERDPLRSSTLGFGQLIDDALRRGARTVVLGLGGSATTDGGSGMLVALGARLSSDDGHHVHGCGADLARITDADLSHVRRRTDGVSFVMANDVDNPLLGPDGAASVFGPQKGADPETVELLDRNLGLFADVIATCSGADLRTAPGAGAAGGVGFAALSVLAATRRLGADAVLDLVGFDELAPGVDLVVTGEGRLDTQSLGGKAPVAVARRAATHGVSTLVVAGSIGLDAGQLRAAGFIGGHALEERARSAQHSMDEAGSLLTELGAELVQAWQSWLDGSTVSLRASGGLAGSRVSSASR